MRWLLAPRWLVAHVVVVALAVVFINLGFWQLRRLDERQLDNTVGESRFAAEPEPNSAFCSTRQVDDRDSLEFRQAIATGVFQPADEVLIRSQVHQGVAGFPHRHAPVGGGGTAVLVNRGGSRSTWTKPPRLAVPPPDGTVTVTGWVRTSQTRGALGPSDPVEGRLETLSRVDIDRIQQQVDYELEPIYLSLLDDLEGDLPIGAPAPSFDDEGPHRAYAIQWFSFAVIGLIGYFFLIRRAARRSG